MLLRTLRTLPTCHRSLSSFDVCTSFENPLRDGKAVAESVCCTGVENLHQLTLLDLQRNQVSAPFAQGVRSRCRRCRAASTLPMVAPMAEA